MTFTMSAWVDGPERIVPRSECTKVTVPSLFYEDHVQRGLAAGHVITAGRYVTVVWLDDVALADLIGDADYYGGFSDEDYQWNRSICDSARRTWDRLKAQAPAAVAAHKRTWEGV